MPASLGSGVRATNYADADGCCCGSQGSGDEPIWHQILQLHLNHSDPEVVQHAAAAMAE
jgi:hypothetical protein